MSRLSAFLVLMLAFSSVCFGATLMQRSMAKSNVPGKSIIKSVTWQNVEQSCQELIKEHQKQTTAKIAQELYNEAYSLSFQGNLQKAKAASKCASHLINGSKHWHYEVKDLGH